MLQYKKCKKIFIFLYFFIFIFFFFRLAKFSKTPLPPEPKQNPTMAYGTVEASERAILREQLETIEKVFSVNPQSFEQLDNPYGYVLYQTTIETPKNSTFIINQVRDRAVVILNNVTQKILYRPSGNNFTLNVVSPNSTLHILMENMGRVNFGSFLFDRKGITENVVFNGSPLLNWYHFSLPLSPQQISSLSFTSKSNSSTNFGLFQTPVFYKFFLFVDVVADSFLNVTGWCKGHIFVNGFNLGSYWDPAGPQHTLYLPATMIVKGYNEIILFEQETPNSLKSPTIQFIDHAIFD